MGGSNLGATSRKHRTNSSSDSSDSPDSHACRGRGGDGGQAGKQSSPRHHGWHGGTCFDLGLQMAAYGTGRGAAWLRPCSWEGVEIPTSSRWNPQCWASPEKCNAKFKLLG